MNEYPIRRGACLLPVLLLLPRIAFSACSVTLNFTQSNNIISYTATSSGTCGGARVDVYVDGSLYDSAGCDENYIATSCTSAKSFNTYCWGNGTHTITAIGHCNRSTGYCTPEDPGSATGSFTTNATPSVSLDIPDPDATGHTVASVTYTFQNTNLDRNPNYDYDRHLRLVTDYAGAYDVTSATETGVWQVPLTLTCLKGTHSFKAYALACAGWPGFLVDPTNPDFIRESQTVSKTVTTKPVIGVSYADSAALDGTGTATISYSFPNTDSNPQRRVRLDLDGSTLHEWSFDAQAGTTTFPINLTCAAPGTHTLVATAFACSNIGPPLIYQTDPDLIAQASTTVTVDHKPAVSVSVDTSLTPPVAIVDYSFPRTNASTQRLLQLVWAATGEVIAEPGPARYEDGRVARESSGLRGRVGPRRAARACRRVRRRVGRELDGRAAPAMRCHVLPVLSRPDMRRFADSPRERQHAHERSRSTARRSIRAAGAHVRQPAPDDRRIRPRMGVALRRGAAQLGRHRRSRDRFSPPRER